MLHWIIRKWRDLFDTVERTSNPERTTQKEADSALDACLEEFDQTIIMFEKTTTVTQLAKVSERIAHNVRDPKEDV